MLQELFVEPVLLAEDGHTYESSALREWLSRHPVSPMTGLVLKSTTILPNCAVKATVAGLRHG